MSDLLKFSVLDAYIQLQNSVRTQVNDITIDGNVFVPADDEENQRIIATELDLDYKEVNEAVGDIILQLAPRLEEIQSLPDREKQIVYVSVGGAAMVSFMAGVLYQQQQVEIVD